MTEGVPRLTGLEPDPMLAGTKAFPGPGGTMFRLISYPPKRPEGYKPPPGVTFESGLSEMSENVPRMGDHFDRSAPGMHTSDTIDYGIVVRGEMTLELDDGQKVHLRQGDCIVQNGPGVAGATRCRSPVSWPSSRLAGSAAETCRPQLMSLFDRAGSVEPNAGQVSERGVKPREDRWRQGWTEDRGDIVRHVSLVAGSEENDVNSLLVTRVAIRGVRDAFRTAFGDQEAERIALGEDRRIEMALLDQLGEDVGTIGGIAEDVADDEHQERADAARPGYRKDTAPRSLVRQAVGRHGDFPGRFLDRPGQHGLFRIIGARLGDADMAHLALFLELHEGGCQDIAMMVIGRRRGTAWKWKMST